MAIKTRLFHYLHSRFYMAKMEIRLRSECIASLPRKAGVNKDSLKAAIQLSFLPKRICLGTLSIEEVKVRSFSLAISMTISLPLLIII